MAEGKQSSGTSGRSSGQSSSGSGKQQSGGKSDAQGKTDQALKDERSSSSGQNQPSEDDIKQRDDVNQPVSADSPGVREDPDGTLVPEENAPGPEPVDEPSISAVDLRPRIEPKDRATFLGAVHARDDQVDIPEEFQLFGDSDGERDMETVDLEGTPVEVFQVVGTNHNLAFRFDGETYVLNAEQARAFAIDMHGVLANVVT